MTLSTMASGCTNRRLRTRIFAVFERLEIAVRLVAKRKRGERKKMATSYSISKAKNGYVIQKVGCYSNEGEPEIFIDFADAIAFLSEGLGEKRFSETIKGSQVMAEAMTNFCKIAVAPSLKAIEVRLNPGIENVVSKKSDDDGIAF